MADDIRESHRADLHQALAYASLFDADEITTTLAHPLRQSTWAHVARSVIQRLGHFLVRSESP